jgi:hypothetical protein
MPAELDTIRTGQHAGTGRIAFGGELPWHGDGVKLTEEQQKQFDFVIDLIDVPLEKWLTRAAGRLRRRPGTRVVPGSVGADCEPGANRDAFAVHP